MSPKARQFLGYFGTVQRTTVTRYDGPTAYHKPDKQELVSEDRSVDFFVTVLPDGTITAQCTEKGIKEIYWKNMFEEKRVRTTENGTYDGELDEELRVDLKADGSYRISIGGPAEYFVTSTRQTMRTARFPPDRPHETKVTVDEIRLPRSMSIAIEGKGPPGAKSFKGLFEELRDDGKTKDTHMWTIESFPIKANPGGPYTVVRGESVTLDASGSVGDIRKYEWSFPEPGGGTATKSRQKATTVFLASMQGKLTVTGRNGESDSATTTVTVTPRSDFKTKCEHLKSGGDMPTDGTAITGTGETWTTVPLYPLPTKTEVAYFRNVCAAGGHDMIHGNSQFETFLKSVGAHFIHPMRRGDLVNGSREGTGYRLALVKDPGGPFDGVWHVKESMLSVIRSTVVNPYFQPGGPGVDGLEPIYDFNARNGKALEMQQMHSVLHAHEEYHTKLMADALATEDPAPKMEIEFGASKVALEKKVDDVIDEAQTKLYLATRDPIRGGVKWTIEIYVPQVPAGGGKPAFGLARLPFLKAP